MTNTNFGAHPIYICAPRYNDRSGGVRAMHLLCHHLNRIGCEAYVLNRTTCLSLTTPFLTPGVIIRHLIERREPIVVYPEVFEGNPLDSRIVVRYLLNKPGHLTPGVTETYTDTDFFFHFAEENAISCTRSFDMFMPLVDRRFYYPPTAEIRRRGFIVYSNRAKVNIADLPPWVRPLTVVSMDNPRSHAELGDLYRHSRAVVCRERGTAIFEALYCGCPVICLEGEHFADGSFHRRFQGAGLIWGWREGDLKSAAAETEKFRTLYASLEKTTQERVESAIRAITRDFASRSLAKQPLAQRVRRLIRLLRNTR